ncbi:MAG: S8 family peptidase [Crocinitomicaceae bacterium]|nr:S8 family peptidase [Crocinitomicaceae bacterium]
MAKLITLTIAFVATLFMSYGQSGAFGFKQLSEEQKERVSSFYLPNNDTYKRGVLKNNWNITSSTKEWIYFTTSAKELEKAYQNGDIPDYFIKYAAPRALNDSMREHHKVNLVHNGIGLSAPYKGKNVIIGLVDTGIETGHPDFMDENGKTRILRMWDQSTNAGGTLSTYGYGIVWDSTQINSGQTAGNDIQGHGSTVAGAAAGNGLSTGYNQGVAPEADIIMIKTDFSLPNWHMTVADACEYVFKVADSLGKQAVINLSVGDYLGSHDGTDPASAKIDSLLDAKNGRIVVAACGNSGNMGKYHCQGHPTTDTTFVWFKNNPSSALGANKVYFDLYSDLSDATYSFALKAVNPSNYSTRATTIYRPALGSLGTPVYDTLWNSNGQRIATVEIHTSQEANNLHLEMYFSNIDTTSYYFGFYTVGSGKYDLWSGTALGLNDMVQTLPSSATLPSIVNYQMPDAHQTIISNWICSPKVISVGNTLNRTKYKTKDGGYYTPSITYTVGELSINSSKGPTRHNIIKPDITASGDVTLAPAPLWYLSDPNNNNRIDTGGWHTGNGGTSMSSPVVAGIAALYLEKCKRGNNLSFLNLIKNHSLSNAYTGSLPNNAYGYGVISAHDILYSQEFTADVLGDPILCVAPNTYTVQSLATISEIEWHNGSTSPFIYQYMAEDVYATVYNENGCGVQTDTLHLTQSATETIDPITVSGDFSVLSTTSSNGTYQWTLNGTNINGATNSTLILDPVVDGIYDCYATADNGCTVYAGSVSINLSIEQISKDASIYLYPNPAHSKIHIVTEQQLKSITAVDVSGKEIELKVEGDKSISIGHLNNGYYLLKVETEQEIIQTKFIKN